MRNLDTHSIGRVTGLFAVTLLLFYVMYSFFGEQSYEQIGIRWDQAFYFSLTENFTHHLLSNKIPVYEFQRILPAALIHAAMKVFDVSFTTANIIRAYDIYNAVIIGTALFFWFLINKKSNTSSSAFFIGTVALFCNSAVLKIYPYQPINTDSMAFLLGMMLIYAHLSRNILMMFIIVLASSFTWPSAMYLGIVLLIGHNIDLSSIKSNPHQPFLRNRFALLMASLCAVGLVVVILLLVYVLKAQIGNGTTPIIMSLLPLSLLATAAYLFVVIYMSLAQFDLQPKNIFYLIRNIRLNHIALALLLAVVVKSLIAHYSNHQTGGLNLFGFVRNVTLSSITIPFKSIIAHISYFGPIVILFIFCAKRFFAHLSNQNMALFGFILIHLIQAMAAESRQLIYAYPFIVFILIQSIQELQFKKSFFWFFLLSSLLFSRFWYPINQTPFPSLEDPTDYFQSFPWQHFAMLNGAWLSHDVYLIMLPIALITACFLYFAHLRGIVPTVNASHPLHRSPDSDSSMDP